jgi:fructoselysine-6-P-deglycase FrlB-like protein
VTETTTPPTHVEREIASQPRCWEQTVGALPDHLAALPAAGERVAVIGCGTSLFVARAYAALREAAGHGETDAFSASEYRFGRRYDRVVTISRSGTTTEVLEVIDAVRGGGGGTAVTSITVDASSPVGGVSTDVVALPFIAEQSVVQTRFPTSVLAMLRASLGEDLTGVIAAATGAVSAALPVAADVVRQITFLGTGWAAGIADEAALKCREAAGFWTESYPAMEYRHGPISVSGPRSVVWVFGDPPSGLSDDVAATGAQLVSENLDPMVDLIRAQRLAVELARHAGRDPDHPPSLTFSVILPPERVR